jgi:hypothetical protein
VVLVVGVMGIGRVYADVMLALDKHRGKGQQRVIVEHVHVHPGCNYRMHIRCDGDF